MRQIQARDKKKKSCVHPRRLICATGVGNVGWAVTKGDEFIGGGWWRRDATGEEEKKRRKEKEKERKKKRLPLAQH